MSNKQESTATVCPCCGRGYMEYAPKEPIPQQDENPVPKPVYLKCEKCKYTTRKENLFNYLHNS